MLQRLFELFDRRTTAAVSTAQRSSGCAIVGDAVEQSNAVIEFGLDGIILRANEHFCTATGYKVEELVGQHHRIFMDPNELNGDYDAFWQSLRSGKAHSGEFKRRRKDQTTIWLCAFYCPVRDANGELTHIVKVASDISTAKEQALAATARLDAINTSNAVIEFATDGTIKTANANFLTCSGYSLGEIVGKHHRIFMDPSDLGPAYEAFWQALGRGEFQCGEFKRVRKNGSVVWLDASYEPIRDLDGRIVGVVKIARDITASVEVRLTNEELAARTGQLVNNMSGAVHELSVSMQEIASNTRHAQSRAEETSGLVTSASKSGAFVASTAEAMDSIIVAIVSIAAQTKMLSLNATIEAARAGEAGRGFAVVASEVKALAGQTAEATESISKQINELRSVAAGSAEAVGRMEAAVEQVQEYVTQTAAAIEEQSTTANAMSCEIQAFVGKTTAV